MNACTENDPYVWPGAMALLRLTLVSISSARSSSHSCPMAAAAPPRASTAPVSQEMKCHRSNGISLSTAPIGGGSGAAVCAESVHPRPRITTSAAHEWRMNHGLLQRVVEDISVGLLLNPPPRPIGVVPRHRFGNALGVGSQIFL